MILRSTEINDMALKMAEFIYAVIETIIISDKTPEKYW